MSRGRLRRLSGMVLSLACASCSVHRHLAYDVDAAGAAWCRNDAFEFDSAPRLLQQCCHAFVLPLGWSCRERAGEMSGTLVARSRAREAIALTIDAFDVSDDEHGAPASIAPIQAYLEPGGRDAVGVRIPYELGATRARVTVKGFVVSSRGTRREFACSATLVRADDGWRWIPPFVTED